jgi:hypothetical protein
MGDERTDERICEMIGAAVLSGAYSTLAREIPDARPGLMKLARKWSARAGTLANEICADAGRQTPASATMTSRPVR